MVYFCEAAECSSHTKKASKLHIYPFMRTVSWVHWPKDEASIKRWKQLIRREGRDRSTGYVDKVTLTRKSRLCSRHFDADDINSSGRATADPKYFAWNNWGKPTNPRKTATSSKVGTFHEIGCDAYSSTEGGSLRSVLLATNLPDISCEIQVGEGKETTNKIKLGNMQPLDSSSTASHAVDHDYIKTSAPALVSQESQTDLTVTDILKLEEKAQELKNLTPEHEVNRCALGSDERVNFYTGFDSKDLLFGVFESIKDGASKMKYWSGAHSAEVKDYERKGVKAPGPERQLTLLSEFVMTLMRLRLNLPLLILADLYGVSCSLVTKITITWISYMHQILVPALIVWPTQEQVRQRLPLDFRKDYPKTRCVTDASEFYVERPANKLEQYATFSSYKHHNTYKALLATNPNGKFTFVSELWSGNVSDKFITQHSGLVDLLEADDDLMADRGFQIEDLLSQKRARLVAPPFTRKWNNDKSKRLNVSEIRKTKQIAKLRIHIERAIQRLKTFRILKHVIPSSLKDIASMILQVVAAICNLKGPLYYGRDEQHLKKAFTVKRKKPVKRCQKGRA